MNQDQSINQTEELLLEERELEALIKAFRVQTGIKAGIGKRSITPCV